MAIKVMEKGSGSGCNCVTSFLCDTESDINDLPTEDSTGKCGNYCSAGSVAIVLENGGSKWVLGNTGEWTRLDSGIPSVIGGVTLDEIAGG